MRAVMVVVYSGPKGFRFADWHDTFPAVRDAFPWRWEKRACMVPRFMGVSIDRVCKILGWWSCLCIGECQTGVVCAMLILLSET